MPQRRLPRHSNRRHSAPRLDNSSLHVATTNTATVTVTASASPLQGSHQPQPGQLLPAACLPAASWCHTAPLPPPKFNDTGSGLVLTLLALSLLPAHSRPLRLSLSMWKGPHPRQKRPCSPRPSPGGWSRHPQLGHRCPLPCWGAGRPGSGSQPGKGAGVGSLSQQGLPPHPPQWTCSSHGQLPHRPCGREAGGEQSWGAGSWGQG